MQLESAKQLQNVKDLLDWKADPNTPFGPTRMTALHMAASWNQTTIVKLLLDARSDPQITDVNGMAPLHLACIFGDNLSVEALMNISQANIDQVAATPFGEMRPLDCALESR